MKRLRLSPLTLCAWLCASLALAAPPSEQTLACVSASTEAQVERDKGHLLAARARLLSCAQAACPSIVSKRCVEWLVDLDRRIPSVVLRVSEPSEHDVAHASVLIDGAPVALDGLPVPLDPGAHSLVASAPGWALSERKILLAEGEQARLLVLALERPKAPIRAEPDTIEPPPALQPAAQGTQGAAREPAHFRVPVASFILGGLGVAGIVSFAVLRVQAEHELNHLHETCAPTCSDSSTQRGRHLALAADVSLGVGVAALAGAGAWALGSWLRRDRETTRVVWVPTQRGMFASLVTRY
jgi:hypothetical protein